MNEQIKIIMLGDSASGKTCYILAMSAAMQFGNHGFTITAIDPVIPDKKNAPKRIEENGRLHALWSKIVNESGKQRWPLGDDQMRIYNFEFSEGLDSKIKFEWVDYRGSAMSEEYNQLEVQELKQQFLQSSGVFLCISGKYLQEEITERNIAKIVVDTKANFMIKYLVAFGKQIHRETRQFFPIIITISQYDLCYQRNKEDVIKDIKRIFPSLFIENAYWHVMICPVSLGEELALNPDYGKIVPKNVHIPIIFALYCKLGQICKSQDQEYKKNLDILDDLEESNSFIKLIRWIRGDKIRNIKKELKKNEDESVIYRELMTSIFEELTNTNTNTEATTYFNGQETVLDLDWF